MGIATDQSVAARTKRAAAQRYKYLPQTYKEDRYPDHGEQNVDHFNIVLAWIA
jgi:hypothetical protein